MYLLVNGFGENGPKIRRTKVEPPLKDTSKVSDLRTRVASILKKKKDSFILMHCGVSIIIFKFNYSLIKPLLFCY